jgi:LAO/AO transport system kinase
VQDHRAALESAGELDRRRAEQQVEWMWRVVRDRLLDRLQSDEGVREALPAVERAVRAGELTPTLAAEQLLDRLDR